jgi:hypothetical protein
VAKGRALLDDVVGDGGGGGGGAHQCVGLRLTTNGHELTRRAVESEQSEPRMDPD